MNSNQDLKKSRSDGEKVEFISSLEWNEHSLGDMNEWPQSFKTALNIVLNNSQPAFLLWEEEAYTFPNKKFVQEYLPNTSSKKITGLIAQTAISEFWKLFKNEAETLFHDGQPFEKTVHVDRTEEVDSAYYNLISLNASPVHLEDGSIGGMIVICTDVMPNYVMANELKDRVKEQETLQNISRLTENFSTTEEYLTKLAELIPPAMQFPKIAEAAIEFNGAIYKSENYNDCKNSVFKFEESSAGKKLVIHVGYTQETSQATKSSVFVQKEKKLVKTIASQAANTIDSFHTKQIFEQAEKEKKLLFDRITDGFLKIEDTWEITAFNRSASELLNIDADAVIGKNLMEIFPEVKNHEIEQVYKSALSNNSPESAELYMESLGSLFSLTIYPDDDGVSVFFSDITQDIQKRNQHNQLSRLVDEVHNGIVILNADNRIKWTNKTFTELTGFSPDDAIGRSMTELLPGPETDLKSLQRIIQKLDDRDPMSEQMLYYTKDGDELWIKKTGTPVFDEDGSLSEYIFILEDVSKQIHLENLLGQVQNMAKIGGWDYEMDRKKWIRGSDRPEYLDGKFVRIFDNIENIQNRKKIEEQYNQSRKLLEALVDQVDAGIWVIDGNEDMVLMNRECKKLFNLPENIDVLKKSFNDILDHKSAAYIEECTTQVLETKKPKTFIEDKTIDSEDRTYLTNIFPLKNIPGLENAVGAVYTNITRLKKTKNKLGETEQKLKEVIDHSTNLFYSHTSDHELTYLSPQSKHFLGLDPDEASVKWTDLTTDHPVNEKALEITNKALETGEPQPSFELQLRKANGEIIWVEAHESPIVKNGTTVAIAGSLTDITKRKKTENKLKESLNEKETLLSEIHHRVKNNLAIVSGLMQLQAFNTENEEFAKMLNVSVSRMRSIAGIHEQLYQSNSFSSIDISQSLKKLVTEVIGTMQIPTKIHKDLNLQSVNLSMDQALPCSLIVNEVITNTLKHAFVESEEGTITMQLSEKNNRVTLVISDDGVGLPDNFSIEKSESLGMELINTLSEQLEADISYQSVGSGTRFEISFDNAET